MIGWNVLSDLPAFPLLFHWSIVLLNQFLGRHNWVSKLSSMSKVSAQVTQKVKPLLLPRCGEDLERAYSPTFTLSSPSPVAASTLWCEAKGTRFVDLTKLSKLKDCASGRSGETLANGKVSITLSTAEALWASCRALESKAPLTCRPWGGGMVMRCDE